MSDPFSGAPSWWARPTGSLRYIVHARAFALASAIRLTLPDALEPEWLGPGLVHLAGAVVLAANGSILGWALCAIGISYPLLALSDQLTQSVFLLGCCLAAMVSWLGSAERRGRRMAFGFPFAVRLLTIGVYLMAGIHKINRDFLTPDVSCANGGLRILAADWGLPQLDGMAGWNGWAITFVIAELMLPVLFVVRPAAAVLLGLLFHIPLTIVFAPSFAFTMMSGWITTTTARNFSIGQGPCDQGAWHSSSTQPPPSGSTNTSDESALT